jgi:DNA-binding HxlR family transcriptional regulator
MGRREYGQFCGLARALELVGERWGLLIVRDLLVGPRRFTDLHRGLPRIPTNVLATRLHEMEDGGVVRRRLAGERGGTVVYELTDYGRALDDVVLKLGRWGSASLGEPRADEIVTSDSLVIALRSTFDPAAAKRLRANFELHVGEIVVHARVHDGEVNVGVGGIADADVHIEAGLELRALMAGEMTIAEARRRGALRAKGNRALLDRFVAIFRIPPLRTRSADSAGVA